MPRGADISPLSLLLGRVDEVADGATPVDTVPSGFPGLDKLLGGGHRVGFDHFPEGMRRSAHYSKAAPAPAVPAVRQPNQAEQESSHTDLQP